MSFINSFKFEYRGSDQNIYTGDSSNTNKKKDQ